MAIISGSITDSAGNPLNGELQVTVSSFEVVSDTMVRLPEPAIFQIISGNVLIELDPLEQPYHFEFYKITTTPAPDPDDPDIVERTRLLSFFAKVPNQATVLFSELTPTQIVRDNMDTSAKRVAQLVARDPFLRSLVALTLNPRGDYDPNAYYTRDDLVNYDGGSYMATYAGMFTGVNPTTGSPYWFQLSQRGEPGTGTAGNNTPYDPVGWVNQLDAPSRNAVRDAIEDLKNTIQNLSYAPIDSPSFTGNVSVPTVATGDQTTAPVNGITLWNSLQAILSPDSPGSPYCPVPSPTNNTQAIVPTSWFWDRLNKLTRPADNGDLIVRDGTLALEYPIPRDTNDNTAASTEFVHDVLSPVFANPGDLFPDIFNGWCSTPPPSSNDRSIANTEWVRELYNSDITPWQDPVFNPGWSNYGLPYELCKYRIYKGVLQITGFVKRDTSSTNLTIFTLPPSFRPANHHRFFTVGRFDLNDGEGTKTSSLLMGVSYTGGVVIISLAIGNTSWSLAPSSPGSSVSFLTLSNVQIPLNVS